MTGFMQSTSTDDQDTHGATGEHSDAMSDSHADTAAHPADSTAAERMGGPSDGEQESAHSARANADAAGQGSTGQGAVSQESDSQGNATLIPREKAEGFRGRWKDLKGDFVDEPRTAVRGANELVGEVLDELEQLFRRQRDELESGLDSDDTSTEDLRQALGKYRSFFDRLLSV